MPDKPSRPRSELYRSAVSTPGLRKQFTVGRDTILHDTLDHLRSAVDRRSKHHFLFLGPRGIGKTHLLSLVQDEIAADLRLATRIVVARFPEQSLGTLSFADFLLRLVSLLADQLPAEPPWRDLLASLSAKTDGSEVVDTVVPLLRSANHARSRTIVVMVEHLNELLSKQIRSSKDIAALRKFFMDNNGCLLMATAPMPFDAITDVGQPFYDFFDTQLLRPLDKEQTTTLLGRFVDWDQNGGSHDLEEAAPLAMAIHDLVEGNPRLIVMMCERAVHDGIRSAGDVLLHLADRITPTYQATLDVLAPQERAVLETMAAMRGAKRPRTPGNISQEMGLSVGQISSLLNRLTERRLVKHETDPRDRRSRSYSLRDGFLDVWLAIHLNQSLRRRMVAICECLVAYYRKSEGPFLKFGKANGAFQMAEWPEARQLLQDPASSQHYLCEFQRSLTQWLNNRSGDFEELALQLTELGGISVQTMREQPGRATGP